MRVDFGLQNGGQETFIYRSATARYALTDPPAGIEISPNSFNATEIHCTEYFAGTTAGGASLVMVLSPLATCDQYLNNQASD